MKKFLTLLLITGIAVYLNSCSKNNPLQVTPKACFSFSPTTIKTGDAVTFSSSCSANAASFAWDFGDGGTSTDASPSHTYTTAGDFTVSLTVKDAAGLSNQTTQTLTVAQGTVPPTTHSGDITASETWAEGVHEITGEVYVDNGATLTIAPGAIVKFDQNTGIFIGYNSGTAGSTLIANGTASKPILFTSAATTQNPGDWEYIGFYSGASSNCSMKYCTVEYGGQGGTYGDIHVDDASVTIENSYIQHSSNDGITVSETGSFKSFTADTLRNNASGFYDLEIGGDNANTIGLNNGFMSNTGVHVTTGTNFTKANATWNKLNCSYIIDGDFYIENTSGAKLILAPGVKIAFTHGSMIDIGYDSNTFGTLIADGTATDSIYFTSASIAGSQTAGDWGYIGFWSGAGSGSSLSYVSANYGGGYGNKGEIYVTGSTVKIENSNISNSAKSGINCDSGGGFVSFDNNVLKNDVTYPVIVGARFANTIGTGNTFGTPGILVNAETIISNVTWLAQPVPYIINGEIYVESNSGNTLTISPGTTVAFDQNSDIEFGYDSNTSGKLIAQGTAAAPITFTSAAPAGNQSAGDWNSIYFYSGTMSGSILDHCNISYGGGSSGSGDIYIQDVVAGRLTITNCNITDSSGYGVYNSGSTATPDVSTDTFANNASGNTN